jgi:hypothetical protein
VTVDFVKEGQEPLATPEHWSEMVQDHQITIVVENDPLREGRYRWAILHFGRAEARSKVSFPTRREAEAAAAKVLRRKVPSNENTARRSLFRDRAE